MSKRSGEPSQSETSHGERWENAVGIVMVSLVAVLFGPLMALLVPPSSGEAVQGFIVILGGGLALVLGVIGGGARRRGEACRQRSAPSERSSG
jgi:hypothetical protein